MKNRFRYIGFVFLFITIFVFGLTGGVMLDRFVTVAHAQSVSADSPLNTELILQAWRLIDANYVDRTAVDKDRLTYGAITGMVDSLGDTGHSSFLTPEMLTQHNNYTNGQFEGIGAQVEKKGDYVIITAPMDDSPALKAGLKPGDAILKVNGEDMTGKTVEYVISKILGPAGTQVTLVIIDGKDETQREITLTRAVIKVNDVTWAQVPGTTIAVIRITGFSDKIGDRLKQALKEIQAQKMTGVVLDLRNNPGGLLDEAITTISQFVNKGNALLEKDSQGNIEPIKVQPGGLEPNLPMAVLINYGSASASEIVAGALQDAGRARLVGETTFGTGTVLNTFPLSDGSAMLLATHEWLTPNGRLIWHQGIKPDDKVSLPAGVAPLTPGLLKIMNKAQYNASQDLQLQRAVQWLTCPLGNCSTGANQTPVTP
ncbi:MAG TPA: S41 family peptidase [Anaerolineae bacterium]|nr:S41 family peptidase [Anaerolineae bacterium]